VHASSQTQTKTRAIAPEVILIALFHKVGANKRIADDNPLDAAFNKVALQGGIFSQFRWHRHYHCYEVLHETIVILMSSGLIIRFGLTCYLMPSAHTVGPYGREQFLSLTRDEQEVVELLAHQLRE